MKQHSDIRIAAGFLPQHRAAVAASFWQAFSGKLAPVLGPETRALAFLDRTLDPGFALSATDADGSFLGVAGFKTDQGALVGGGLRDLAAIYGWVGTPWRLPILALLERETKPGVLLMDGIFVTEAARGKGVGTLLLQAIKAEATRRGAQSVRLDVIDSNPRARALYERQGFVAMGTHSIGPLRHLFGFSKATTMVFHPPQPEHGAGQL